MTAEPSVSIDAVARQFHPNLLEALPQTPVQRVSLCGHEFWVKRDDLQTTGSFKVRGALTRLAYIERYQSRAGVITASHGNHGKGVAWAAAQLGIVATVVVPRDTPNVKCEGIRKLGAELIIHDQAGYDAAEVRAKRLADERNAIFVSAFDDPLVQAGNGGTLGLEILAQLPHVERVLIPVGGGGLATGMALTIHASHPLVEIVGAQSTASPAMARSLRDGFPHLTWPPAPTLAEGLEGGVAASTFEACRVHVPVIHEVGEAAIAEAMGIAWRTLGVALEGSAAVTLAAILDGLVTPDLGTVVVFTGSNVDHTQLETLAGSRSGV